MGRRFKQDPNPPWGAGFPDGPVEGVLTENRVYFEAPQVLTIGTPVHVNSSYTHPNYNRNADVISSSPIRLASSRKRSICPEIHQPASVIYALSLKPTQEELDEYMRECETYGFGQGAIVARRFCQPFRQTQCTEWGMIVYAVGQTPHYSQEMQGPFNVKWFDSMKDSERAWAEDLIVIHAAMPKDILQKIVDQQLEYDV